MSFHSSSEEDQFQAAIRASLSGNSMRDEAFNVTVQFPDGDCGDVETRGSQMIGALRSAIEQRYGRDVITTKLTFEGTELQDDKLVSHYNIQKDSLLCQQMQIYVGFLSKKGILIDVNAYTEIIEVKAMIESMDEEYPMLRQRIFSSNGIHLEDQMTMSQCSITDGENLFVHLRSEDAEPPKAGCIQIYVRCDNDIHTLDVEPSDAVSVVQNKLLGKVGAEFQRISFCNEYLEDQSRTLWESGINSEALLYFVRGKGGKKRVDNPANYGSPVHGNDGEEGKITIFLMNSAQETDGLPFKMTKNTTLHQVFQSYSRKMNIPLSNLSFFHDVYGDLPVDCEFTAEALGLNDGDNIFVKSEITNMFNMERFSFKRDEVLDLTIYSSSEDLSPVEITISLQGIGEKVLAKIDKNSTSLGLLFTNFAERKGIAPASLVYVYNGRRFSYDADETAGLSGIGNGDTIYAIEKKELVVPSTCTDGKLVLYFLEMGKPESERDFFRVDANVTLEKILKFYATRREVDISTLRFFYHGRVLYADSYEISTPLKKGICEGDVVQVASVKQSSQLPLTPNSVKTLSELRPGRIFEPVVQVFEVNKKQKELTISDGSHFATVSFNPRIESLINSGALKKYSVILVRDFDVKHLGQQRSISLLDAKDAAPNPQKILGSPKRMPDITPLLATTATGNSQKKKRRLEEGLPYLEICHNKHCPGNSAGELKMCSQCRFVGYCSPECQSKSWKAKHKAECRYFEAYYKSLKQAEEDGDEILLADVVFLWFDLKGRLGKPLTLEVAMSICNSSLYCAFCLIEADSNLIMVKGYILNAAFLRQICDDSTPFQSVVDWYHDMVGEDDGDVSSFLQRVPHLKDGHEALSSKESMLSYLKAKSANSELVLNSPSSSKEAEKVETARLAKVRGIVARNVIADFIWRYNEMHKEHKLTRARKTIADVLWRRISSLRRQKFVYAVKLWQKMYRGHSARRIHGDDVQKRLEEFRQFTDVWKGCIEQLPTASPTLSGWALVRERIDVKKMEFIDEDGNLAETDEKLNRALIGAMNEEEEFGVDTDSDGEDFSVVDGKKSSTEANLAKIDWTQFQVTSHVVKFMKTGDAKYREIFVKKMKQLAKGERSHKLQKPLKGCETVIYETYLENKSGFRILWTQEGDQIVVWFISKHKSVSRLAKLIDDAKSRTSRQQIPEIYIDEFENGSPQVNRKILLDALGNVPLKLYDVSFDNVNDLMQQSWTPQMHLTEEERKVVEAKGTVLLLGRSGTGKTVCICNRIEFDRQRLGDKPNFSQIFVSRSSQLCRYVKDTVGITDGISFTTFDKLVRQLLDSFSDIIKKNFQPRHQVSFMRFNTEFYMVRYPQEDISALIVWKSIRTFLKGSIEAYQTLNGFLSREYFLTNKLGKTRCKVPLELRGTLYDIFEQYQLWIEEEGLWDDCDRIKAVLKGIEETRLSCSSIYEENIARDKIYVDEVQDYTQIEILLFFYVGSGPGSLFLAGDPAQSVVEGTDFRFEEVRSVGYFVAGERKHLIPEKPKIVNVNFRSHAGILNCASGFLDLLFKYFPGSAKQLKKDHGLFKGARPGVFHNVDVHQLSSLLQEKMHGAVVLTHDSSLSRWREVLGHKLVYGIREAKGMEFKTVIILDFFAEIPSSLQKPWRDLLLNRYQEDSDYESQFPLVETHLKLIYTAVTRCIEQLFIAETTSSIAGDAVKRWLTTTSTTRNNKIKDETRSKALATLNNVKDLESMTMTHDEFTAVGIDNAQLAETLEIENQQALSYLDRATFCFQEAQNFELVEKAKAHCRSIEWRLKLAQRSDHHDIIEKEGSEVLELLLRENLIQECMNLLATIAPYMTSYKQQKLEKILTSRIRFVLES